MNLGNEIIQEQKNQQEYGCHFSYEGYQLLKEIKTFKELNLVLRSWGINSLKEEMNAKQIYEEIKTYLKNLPPDTRIMGGLFSD
jgi:hypothetical protein